MGKLLSDSHQAAFGRAEVEQLCPGAAEEIADVWDKFVFIEQCTCVLRHCIKMMPANSYSCGRLYGCAHADATLHGEPKQRRLPKREVDIDPRFTWSLGGASIVYRNAFWLLQLPVSTSA